MMIFCSLSGCNVVQLSALTFTVESAYDSVQSLSRRTEERLLRTREKSERQKLKYEIRKLSKLEHMSGGGYFEISKSTLTSMLSVRQIFSSDVSDDLYFTIPASPTLSSWSSSSSLHQAPVRTLTARMEPYQHQNKCISLSFHSLEFFLFSQVGF